MILRDFNETFAYELKDPEFAAGYLQACLEYETVDAFLVALKEVAKANGGMTKLAEAASLGRESLYKTLSAQGNPEFKTLNAILSALGMRFAVVRDGTTAEASPDVTHEEDAPREALQAA